MLPGRTHLVFGEIADQIGLRPSDVFTICASLSLPAVPALTVGKLGHQLVNIHRSSMLGCHKGDGYSQILTEIGGGLSPNWGRQPIREENRKKLSFRTTGEKEIEVTWVFKKGIGCICN